MNSFSRIVWQGLALGQLAWSAPAFFARLWELSWYGGLLREWTEGLGLPAGAKILEVGCSAGRLSGELARRGYAVVGTDRSARAIRLAGSAARDGSSPPRFMVADALHLPFVAPEFGATIAASLVNVVSDPEQLLAEMMRVTAPGGIVACLCPTPAMRPDRARRLAETRGYHGFSDAALSLWASMANKREPDTVALWMERAGLVDIRQQTYLDGMVGSSVGRRPLNG